jgi:ribose-phosphate pyrophosphokinase
MEAVMGAHHPLHIFSGSANRPLAEAVTQILNAPLGQCTTTHLRDSEIHVTIEEVVRDQDVFIIQPCSAPVNDHLMELILYVDAFRRASAHEITAVIPYYPYGRQERMAKGREAISAKVVATMLEAMRVSRVLYFDVHAPAIQGFFDVPVDPLTALPVLAGYFKQPEFRDAVIVSPDVGRAKFAGRYAENLGLPLVVMHKRRQTFSQAEVTHVVGDIEGKIPIVIDDVIASGSVLDETNALIEAGARPEIYLAITHGVLLSSALDRLDSPHIRQLVISDTICQPEVVRQHPKVRVLSVANLLAQVIWRIHIGESISDLIEKH